ncbi:hypothetical protein BSKO_06326 [Bryopsis sp. KO-2023]|nr:hypothetical protein BSKO_06326 [Bryopsis sp. KO-2023]
MRRSVSGDNASPWSQEPPRGAEQFQLSDEELRELRKLQQLQKSQAQLLAEGTAGFKSWGSDKEAGQLDLGGGNVGVDVMGFPRRGGGLPPRAPVSADRPKDLEGVQGQLPTVPSMVDRLSDNTKDYVDPKDAQNLLPSSLLDSTSLDLASYLEAFEAQRHLEAAGISLPALNLMDPSSFDLSALQNALPQQQPARQQFVDPGALNVVPASVPPSIPPDTNVLPLRRRTIHHQRSNSEPVFALPAYPAPSAPSGGLRTVPVLAVLPDFSVLPADYIDGQGLSARGTSFSGVVPNRSRDRTMSFDHANLYAANQERGANRPGSRADNQHNESRRRRNKGRRTMSVDMGGLQNKMNFPKPERKPNAKSSKSTPTKTEVKRLVKYQVWVGKPIRTPWFRDSPRDGGEDEEGADENRPAGKGDSHSDGAVSPVSSPVTRPRPTPKLESVTIPNKESAVPATMSSGNPTGFPSANVPSGIPSGIPRPTSTSAAKGTGFFCPTPP